MFLRLWAWLPASLRSNFALLPFAEFGLWIDETLGRDTGTVPSPTDSVAAVSLRKSGLDVAHGNKPLGCS